MRRDTCEIPEHRVLRRAFPIRLCNHLSRGCRYGHAGCNASTEPELTISNSGGTDATVHAFREKAFLEHIARRRAVDDVQHVIGGAPECDAVFIRRDHVRFVANLDDRLIQVLRTVETVA